MFDVSGEQQTLVSTLTGHDGPVWACGWAHPKFGVLLGTCWAFPKSRLPVCQYKTDTFFYVWLASCGFDNRVILWREVDSQNQKMFTQVYASPATLHEASVNAVAWAPHEHGLQLACASSDGSVSVLQHASDGTWTATKIPNAHQIGCTGVSWSPGPAPGSLVSGGSNAAPVKRLVTSGCDNLAKIWRFDGATNAWREESVLRGHTDWVRDACWSVNMGLPMNTVATCGQDGLVLIWTQNEPGGEWNKTVLHDFKVPVWRVSWSVMGNVLAVSDANNLVTVWKESVDGKWDQISATQ